MTVRRPLHEQLLAEGPRQAPAAETAEQRSGRLTATGKRLGLGVAAGVALVAALKAVGLLGFVADVLAAGGATTIALFLALIVVELVVAVRGADRDDRSAGDRPPPDARPHPSRATEVERALARVGRSG